MSKATERLKEIERKVELPKRIAKKTIQRILGEIIAQKFMTFLDENNINPQNEDEAVCIFEQLVGEEIERQN